MQFISHPAKLVFVPSFIRGNVWEFIRGKSEWKLFDIGFIALALPENSVGHFSRVYGVFLSFLFFFTPENRI